MARRQPYVRASIWAIAAVLLPGCLGFSGGPDSPGADGEGGVSYRTLSAGLNSSYPESADLVITSASEWEAFWEHHSPDVQVISTTSPPVRAAEPPPPSVDFGRETVIAIMMGPQPSNCYGLDLSSVVQDSASSFRVEVVETRASGDERVCDSMETGPHQIISVPTPRAPATVVRIAAD